MDTGDYRGAILGGNVRQTPITELYSTPAEVKDLGECDFYHTIDIPGYGCVEGEWDLRKGIRKYLGECDFKGKRVLDVGTASGFLCFYMESQGADVVAYDLSENHTWDIVPYSRCNYTVNIDARKSHIKRLNNGFWLIHRALKSQAKVVYGTVYTIPEQIGMVDISVFGCILLHLQNPFLALQNALRLTKETVVIADITPKFCRLPRINILPKFIRKFTKPYMKFQPEFSTCSPNDAWWVLPPEIIVKFIGMLGFEKTKVSYHIQKYLGRPVLVYTVVGKRTSDIYSGQ